MSAPARLSHTGPLRAICSANLDKFPELSKNQVFFLTFAANLINILFFNKLKDTMNSFRFSSLLIALLCFCTAFARTEYDEVSEKDIKAAATAEAKFNQVTADNYHYIYWVSLNAPAPGSDNCTITIDKTTYTITDFAGSAIRKELSCTDPNGDKVTIVFKLEEMPDARNSSVLKMYVDKYPGRRPNQESIDATCENNLYALKNYGGASILYSKTNSRVTEPKKYKAGIYTTLFEWINAHLGNSYR